ncbi:nicotinamide N-methyltransferase [Sistotremastrum niveocremeum HHB9708]|uniref:Protein N-terminal and lysine N-methyltransferase EFM7 n=1 Tax=Sistotremastrum niveocremeum HHB9708 TaxID=1314777 RepID=A0A164QLI7_9AGAM|nr:nicotinamide N-methyltransferase [Sistotremastrum niveocremeum HHB9708]
MSNPLSTDSDDDLGDLFQEPSRPPSPLPSFAYYTSKSGRNELKIRLVGSHPLWAHHLWNAARRFAQYLEDNPEFCRDRVVLELGAGGALPGLIAATLDARKVVITDYPDPQLIRNIEINVENNIPYMTRDRVSVQGHIWGKPVEPLFESIRDSKPHEAGGGFDMIILSDLVFNHSQHDALLQTCSRALLSPSSNSDQTGSSKTPCLLVFFTHHRPHLVDEDMNFFQKAEQQGWKAEKVVEDRMKPMFPDDPGDEVVRATVHGWRLWRV